MRPGAPSARRRRRMGRSAPHYPQRRLDLGRRLAGRVRPSDGSPLTACLRAWLRLRELTISNVLFAKVTPHDPRHNRCRHTLHNYIRLRALKRVRPDGARRRPHLRYTLDARNPGGTCKMAPRRPPRRGAPARRRVQGSGRHRRRLQPSHAGTLARRLAAQGGCWQSRPTCPATARRCSSKSLDAHPKQLLGRLPPGRGMYRGHELTVEATGPLDEALREALDSIALSAHKLST